MDIDLEDLDAKKPAQSRPTRFAPKNSKLKPKPKTEPPPPPQNSNESSLDSKLTPPLDAKIKIESSLYPSSSASVAAATSANGNDIVKMDIVPEPKPEGNEPKDDLMEVENIHEEEEDHVVREIDVYFTPSMDSNTQLYVLQYPLRPCWRPYELDERCEGVRVKPATSEVEFDLSIDAHSKNYDPYSENAGRMTKQVLSSSWKPPHRNGYAVGVLRGNKLHLNPVHAVVQLRPSMQHFKSGGPSHVEDVVKEEKSVGPSRKQQKQQGNLNEPSEDTGEKWVPLEYLGAKSDAAGRYLQNMVAEEDSHIKFLMSSSDYVSSLCPGTSNLKPKGPSRRHLLSLPLDIRLKTWIIEGPDVHRFDALKHLAPSDSDEDVLKVIQELCNLVQGLWVLKSRHVPHLPGSEALARDFALYLYSKNHLVRQKDFPDNSVTIKKMINVFGVERKEFKDWKFKELKDTSFINRYPNIVKKQEQAWETAAQDILLPKIYRERGGPVKKELPKTNNTLDRPATLKKTSDKIVPKTSSGVPGKTSISDETRQALLKALKKVFQKDKVCSFQRICNLLREAATLESTLSKVNRGMIFAASVIDEAPPEELRAIIKEVAIDIHGVYVSKSSPDPAYDGLRQVVIDLLIVEGPNAKLRKASIIEAGKMKLKRADIPTTEYNKVMNELCVSRGSVWVLKSSDGSPD